jgi:cellulose synthase/poly-beta-1,6-N-acetylglucosamine synthase-like glycosyltransferase
MPNWKRRLFLLAPLLCVLTLVSYWVYFTLRIIFVLDAQRKNGESFPMAWVFIGTEISVAVPLFIQTLWNVFILKRRKRAQLRLEGDDVPSVDCFITCCKEEVDVIMDTTRAACEVDWPIDKFRVIVLDDGGDPMLREAVQNLGHVYPNLWYRARTKIPGVPHHFKAGNLNYGLDEVHNMPGGASRFMAALDADMIPERHWLRALMPHLLIDEKCAMACPPQVCCLLAFRSCMKLIQFSAVLQCPQGRPSRAELGLLRAHLRAYQGRSRSCLVHRFWLHFPSLGC